MIEIRPVSIDEVLIWKHLSAQTFHETFAPTNTLSDVELYITTHFTEKKLAEELRDSRRSIYMAWVENQPVGYLNLLDGDKEPCVKSTQPIELARIYVLQSWHGRGVAQLLMDKAQSIAREKNKNGIWLGVWEHNLKAQNFYRKYQFSPVGSHIFQMGNDPQTDLIFELLLN